MSVVLARVSQQTTQSNVYIIGTQRWTTTLNNVVSFRSCLSGNCSLFFVAVDVVLTNMRFSKQLSQVDCMVILLNMPCISAHGTVH
eukprot:9069614-Heterocapsa_arctica.AAC.1